MISRRTIFSLIVMLLIFGGLRIWLLEHRDDCDRPATQLGGKPTSVMVQTGDRLEEVPCTVWLPRQPLGVQMVCLLGLAVGVVFGLSVIRDWLRSRQRRRQQRW